MSFSTQRSFAIGMAAAAFLAVPRGASATDVGVNGHAFGLGLQLGAPSGITGKYYLGGRRNAIDFVVGGFLDTRAGFNNSLYLQGTYLWHPSTLVHDPAFDLDWYVGVGGFVWDLGVWTGAAGAHVPLGLAFDLNDPSVSQLQFYGEIALNVNVLPNGLGWYGIGLAIGGRYYF
jgi:hypothetical protein